MEYCYLTKVQYVQPIPVCINPVLLFLSYVSFEVWIKCIRIDFCFQIGGQQEDWKISTYNSNNIGKANHSFLFTIRIRDSYIFQKFYCMCEGLKPITFGRYDT